MLGLGETTLDGQLKATFHHLNSDRKLLCKSFSNLDSSRDSGDFRHNTVRKDLQLGLCVHFKPENSHIGQKESRESATNFLLTDIC